MLRGTLIALAVLGILFAQTIVAAAEKEDWFPTSSSWTGKGHGKDPKGVEHDRGGFTLLVTSRDEDRFGGTLSTISEGRSPAAKVEVEGTISSARRVKMQVTRVLEGNAPNGFLEAKFNGRIEKGKQLELRADHPSGSYIQLELTREENKKQ